MKGGMVNVEGGGGVFLPFLLHAVCLCVGAGGQAGTSEKNKALLDAIQNLISGTVEPTSLLHTSSVH